MKLLEPFSGQVLPKLETERLILRQRTVEDAEDIFVYASLPEVAEPAGFPAVATLEDELVYLEQIYPQNLAKERLPSGYGITLKGEDRVIGSIDFNHRHGDKVLEIGYLLHPDFWGLGYVPEAGRALLEIAFDYLDLEEVRLVCYDSNHQSQAVARKLGFRLYHSQAIKDVRGRDCQNLTFALTREEWLNCRRGKHAPSY